jgi:outer membrane protein OmpU
MREKMKTLLLASTALVATAGIAAADVTLSGSAEMGVIGGSDIDTQFHTDIDVTFTMSGETDGGLAFGASIDLDEADDGRAGGSLAFGNTTQGGETIFVSYGGMTLTMGDTDGALDWAMSELDYGGAINDDHTSHAGFSGNGGLDLFANADAILNSQFDEVGFGIGLDGLYDGQIARAEYAFGDFAVAASLEVANDRDVVLGLDTYDAKPVFGIAGKYSANGLSFGLGFQTAKYDADAAGVDDIDFSAVGASVSYSMDAITAGLNVGQTKLEEGNFELTVDHIGVGASYTMNALTLAANYGMYEMDIDGLADVEADGFGVSAMYDLGGGLSVRFGYGNSDVNFDGTLEALGAVDTDGDSYSFGLAMSF